MAGAQLAESQRLAERQRRVDAEANFERLIEQLDKFIVAVDRWNKWCVESAARCEAIRKELKDVREVRQ